MPIYIFLNIILYTLNHNRIGSTSGEKDRQYERHREYVIAPSKETKNKSPHKGERKHWGGKTKTPTTEQTILINNHFGSNTIHKINKIQSLIYLIFSTIPSFFLILLLKITPFK